MNAILAGLVVITIIGLIKFIGVAVILRWIFGRS